MFLKRGIELAVKTVVDRIHEVAKPIETKAAIAQVASISAGDTEIGDLIADAMEKVGKDGVITVEESNTIGTTLEVVEGMQFDRGYVSHYMITDSERMEAVLDEPYILITDRKISAVADILPALEKTMQVGKPLLIIAEDAEGGSPRHTGCEQTEGYPQRSCCQGSWLWRPPQGYAQRHCCGHRGQVISEEMDPKLENVTLEMLGQARQIRATKEDTTIVDGRGSADAIQAGSTKFGLRSKRPALTTIGRSSKSAWRSRRWCSSYSSGCCHRNRAQGEEAPH